MQLLLTPPSPLCRFLHVPLVSAERAWAHAMDLKNQIEQNMEPAKRHYLVRRLTKAVAHAAELVQLTAERCDARSNLEAEAYSAWMAGTLLLEKETDWEGALSRFLRARKLLEELFKVGDFDQRATCRHFLDQVEPAVRFCEYQISRRGGAAPDAAAMLASASSGPGADLLSSKLAALAAESQAQRAASTSELTWNGETLPVRDERCRVAVHAAQELEAQLRAAVRGEPMKGVEGDGIGATGAEVDPRIALYDRTINAYSEAMAAVRAAQQLSHQGADAETQRDELAGLGRALRGLELEHTIARNLALAEGAATRLDAALTRQLASVSGKAPKEKAGRATRPEDVARLYDTLVANATELNDLAGEIGGARGEALMDDCAAKIAHYQAARCVYLSHSYLGGGQFAEAAALFQRAEARCKEATRKYDECAAPDAADKARLALLAQQAAAYKTVAAAELRAAALREAEGAADDVDALALDQEKAGKKRAREENGFMVECLDEWEAFAGAGVAQPRIARLPPHPPLVPVRPIVLDTALMCIEPPNIEHRAPKKQAAVEKQAQGTGMVSRLFGWGS